MTHLGVWRITGAAVVMVGLAGCAAGADADEPEPTVLDTPPEASADTGTSESVDSGGEDPEADSPDESEPTPVPASSEGPAQNWPAPDPPDEIYEPTEEGAEALLQYWFDARHFARITGDTEPLEDVSHEDCALCRSHLDRLGEVFENNGWFVSDEDKVVDHYLRVENERVVSGFLALEEADFKSFWSGEFHDETEVDTIDAFGFALHYEDGRWKMADLSYIDEYDPSRLEGEHPPESRENDEPDKIEIGLDRTGKGELAS